jgi:F-type H+-transporting ATPase subunit epsilon
VTGFTLVLQDATHSERIDGVTSFVGEDASGSFGILAGHARAMSALVIGLARFRCGEEAWQYLALPGGVLYFHEDVLTLSTRHYLRDADYIRISTALQEQLLAEEARLHSVKQSLHQMEAELLRRMWEIGRMTV